MQNYGLAAAGDETAVGSIAARFFSKPDQAGHVYSNLRQATLEDGVKKNNRCLYDDTLEDDGNYLNIWLKISVISAYCCQICYNRELDLTVLLN